MQWLTRACLRASPHLWLHRQGLKVETHHNGHVRPHGVLAPSDAFVGQGEWADASDVLMVVEVTSHDSVGGRRDRVEEPRIYAETGIPVHLLIDRETCELTVHSELDGARYEAVRTVPFGTALILPEPVGITLDTERLKNWVPGHLTRVRRQPT